MMLNAGRKRTILTLARQFRCGRARGILHRKRPPRAVGVQLRSSAVIADLDFEDGPCRVVVKQLASDSHMPTAGALFRLHEWIRVQSPRVAEATPRMLAFDDAENLVVMEYIPAGTFLSALRRAFAPFRDSAALCGAATENGARTLAAFHGISCGPPLGLVRRRTNGYYVRGLESLWGEAVMNKVLPAAYRDPARVTCNLPRGFEERIALGVCPVDVKPKNLLVGGKAEVYFIDPDYTLANPILNLSQALAALDRTFVAYPGRFADRRLSALQRQFVRAYFEHAPESRREELLFFYPWAVLQMYNHHARWRPHFRTWLAAHYGRRLARSLAATDHLTRSEASERPDLCFAFA